MGAILTELQIFDSDFLIFNQLLKSTVCHSRTPTEQAAASVTER